MTSNPVQRLNASRQFAGSCAMPALRSNTRKRLPPIPEEAFDFLAGRGSSAGGVFKPALVFKRLFGTFRVNDRFGDQAGILADGKFDLFRNFRVVLEKLLGILPALAKALAVIGEP